MNTEVLEHLAEMQQPNGMFPTIMRNTSTGDSRLVQTITPTYIVALALQQKREEGVANVRLDTIVRGCAQFLESVMYGDSVTGMRTWQFNPFYAADAEETAACNLILYREGMLAKNNLSVLLDHFSRTETDDGVPVWLVDDYSPGNASRGKNAVHDPVVSAMVLHLADDQGVTLPCTKHFVAERVRDQGESLYYDSKVRRFLLALLGYCDDVSEINADDPIFWHQSRREVTYRSPVVSLLSQL